MLLVLRRCSGTLETGSGMMSSMSWSSPSASSSTSMVSSKEFVAGGVGAGVVVTGNVGEVGGWVAAITGE